MYSTHRILAEGSCRILMEVLPPSSDLWSEPCWRYSCEEARGRKKKHPGGGGGVEITQASPLSPI